MNVFYLVIIQVKSFSIDKIFDRVNLVHNGEARLILIELDCLSKRLKNFLR